MNVRTMIGKTIACVAATALIATSMPTYESQAATKQKLSKTSVTLTVGKSTNIKLKGTKKKVTWSSSNKKVAKVKKLEQEQQRLQQKK